MPKNGSATVIGYPDESPRRPRKRCLRRFQDRLHREVVRQREGLKEQFPGRRPPEQIARRRAYLKITADEREHLPEIGQENA
jgi:hypothetical protein